MDKTYWIGRQAAASAMARDASSAKVRLIHYDLAGRYSVKAAQCLPFILPERAPAARDTRPVLHLPGPQMLAAPPGAGSGDPALVRGDPDAEAGAWR